MLVASLWVSELQPESEKWSECAEVQRPACFLVEQMPQVDGRWHWRMLGIRLHAIHIFMSAKIPPEETENVFEAPVQTERGPDPSDPFRCSSRSQSHL